MGSSLARAASMKTTSPAGLLNHMEYRAWLIIPGPSALPLARNLTSPRSPIFRRSSKSPRTPGTSPGIPSGHTISLTARAIGAPSATGAIGALEPVHAVLEAKAMRERTASTARTTHGLVMRFPTAGCSYTVFFISSSSLGITIIEVLLARSSFRRNPIVESAGGGLRSR